MEKPAYLKIRHLDEQVLRHAFNPVLRHPSNPILVPNTSLSDMDQHLNAKFNFVL